MSTEHRDVTCVSGLTKRQAEEFLDWLEAHGYQFREVSSDDGTSFTVRYA
jgi:hypothetical protein